MKHIRGEKHKSRDRQLRRLYNEYRDLQEKAWKMPLVQLKQPIQKGYVKSFTLREDIARRADARVFFGKAFELQMNQLMRLL